MKTDAFGALDTLDAGQGPVSYYRLRALEREGLTGDLDRLPFSIKVLLEAVLRNCDGELVTEDDVRRLAAWNAERPAEVEMPFKPARVILQDFTGVPAVVDLAAMRAAMKRLGGDPQEDQPAGARRPGHRPLGAGRRTSARADALALNVEMEFERNRERYEFLRWGQKAFDNFRVVPPATGIVHQVNLEYLAKVRASAASRRAATSPSPIRWSAPTSHTTMINGLGVVGWGVGGIEAEAVMLGQPIYMLTPEVVGFKLTGKLPDGVTATDLVLTVTQMLRKNGVVDKFVEFFGPGVSPHVAGRPRDDRQHGARIRRDDGLLPRRRRDARLPAPHRPHRGRGRRWSSATARSRACSAPTARREPKFTETLSLDLATVEP